MCIILTCAPFRRPDEQTLKTCWDNNPDGAGFMFSRDGKVYGNKGFMTYDKLKSALKSVPDSSPLVIHFRIATSGGIATRTCHPYPVTCSMRLLHASKWVSDCGLAHNGVIDGMFTDDAAGISDTIFYTKTIVYTVKQTTHVHGETLATNNRATDMLRDTCGGSRLAILDGSGVIKRIGKWYEVATGICASNDTFARPRKWVSADKSSVGPWDEYGLPAKCAGCTSKTWCEAECPFCYDIARELGYTDDDYEQLYDDAFVSKGVNYYAY